MILLIPYFESTDIIRLHELKSCLYYNTQNSHIDEIYVFTEQNIQDITYDKVKIIKCENRPCYSDLFKFANKFNDQVKVISNSDIYFDDSIKMLNEIKNEFICLTRYDVINDTEAIFTNEDFFMRSMDTWAFRTYVNSNILESCKFNFGINGCDTYLNNIFYKNGFSVKNPSLSIKSYHLHLSNIRYYDRQEGICGEHLFVWPGINLSSYYKIQNINIKFEKEYEI